MATIISEDNTDIKQFNYDKLNIKFELEGMMYDVVYLRSSRHQHFPMHQHATYEIRYILSDNEVIFVENTKYNLKKGMICVTGPTVWHQQSSIDNKPFYGYTICLNAIDLRKNDQASDGSHSIINEIFLSKLFWAGEDKHNCRAIFEKIVDEIEHQKLGYLSLVKNYLRELVINLTRNYISHNTFSPRFSNEMTLKTVEEQRMHMLDMALIQWQPSLNELANMLGLSTKQTERLFVKAYNKTYAQKKLELNLRCAAYLLATTDNTIAEICKEARFSTVGYFYRVFKSNYGKTPSQYKKEARGEQILAINGEKQNEKN